VNAGMIYVDNLLDYVLWARALSSRRPRLQRARRL